MTKKQRRAIQEAEWCEQYHRLNWDGCAANDYFVRLFNPNIGIDDLNKSKNMTSEPLKEMKIANNELYFEIAHRAFRKEKIVAYLTQLTPEKINVLQDIIHKELYIETYFKTAKEILEKIQQQFYDFQK